MKKTNPRTNSHTYPPQRPRARSADPSDEPLVSAEQASAALNLPLYYFIDTRKRAELGIPYYSINRMVRYRIRELHKWQVRYAAEQAQRLKDAEPGGAHA